MRVLDKTVQMNENFKPVLLITLELPLTLSGGFHMKGKEFMDQFYEAIKLYEDRMGAGIAWEPKTQDEPDTFAGDE